MLQTQTRTVSIGLTSSQLLPPAANRVRVIFLQGTDDYFIQPQGDAVVASSVPIVSHTVIDGTMAAMAWFGIASVAGTAGIVEYFGGASPMREGREPTAAELRSAGSILGRG